MKKIIRLLSAVMLIALLGLMAPCALADGAAQMVITLGDGSQQVIDVQQLTTSLGETVYWLDMSALDDDQLAALESAQLLLADEAGEVYAQLPLGDAAVESDGLVELPDPMDEQYSYTLMLAPMPMPEFPQDAEGMLAEYGYFDMAEEYVEEYAEEYIEEPVVEEYVEEYIEEPVVEEYVEEYIEEPVVEEYIEEPVVEEYVEEYIEEPVIEEYIEEPIAGIYDVEPIIEEYEEAYTEEPVIEEYVEEPVIEEYIEEPVIEYAEEQGDHYTGERVDETVEIIRPEYVVPNQEMTNLRSEPVVAEDTVMAQLGTADVLGVHGYEQDGEGRIWWMAEDYRTGMVGYIMADVVTEIDEETMFAMTEAIDRAEAESEQETEPEIIEPEIIEPEIIEPEIIEPEIVEPEIVEPEIIEPEIIEPEIIEPAEIIRPEFVTPNQEMTNLRSEPIVAENTVMGQVGVSDVLGVHEYVIDAENRVWWMAEDYRTGMVG
ncbi:MAG: hypothetical protein IJE71_06895, partial [Clostridia bacterium]|nr:hypothetical protein [Clostridia bacterium]